MTSPPHPLRKTFWVGLAVLFLLGSAWLRSRHYWDEATIGILSAENHAGEISIVWNPRIRTWKADFSTYPITSLRPGHPSSSHFSRTPSGIIELKLAHWFITTLALLSWLTLLAWKHQQLKLLTTEAPPDPP